MARVTDEEYNRSLAESQQLLADINAMEAEDPWREKEPQFYNTSEVDQPPVKRTRENLRITLPAVEGESTNSLVTPQQQSLRKDADPYFQDIEPFETSSDVPEYEATKRPGFTPRYEGNYIDKRTNLPYGRVPEEQIKNDLIENLAAAVSTIDIQGADELYRRALTKNSPEYNAIHVPITEVMKVHYQYIEKMMEAQRRMDAVVDHNDLEGIEEARKLRDEAMAIRNRLPMDYPTNGIVHMMLRFAAENAASMVDVLKDAAPGMATTLATSAAGGATIGSVFPGIGTAAGAATGMGLAMKWGLPVHLYQSMKKQGIGEMMLELNQPMGEEEPIPFVIARPVAEKYAVPYAALESLSQMLEFIGGLGLGVSVTKRVVAIASEGGTEFAQTIVQQIARWEAERDFAHAKGAPFDKDINDLLDVYEARLAAGQAVLGTGGMAAVQTVATSPITLPLGAKRVLGKAKQRYEYTRLLRDLKKLEDANKALKDKNKTKPLSDVTDDATNVLVTGEPISQPEVDDVKNEPVVKGTAVSDDVIDDGVINDDDDAAIEDIDDIVIGSIDDNVAEFYVGLSEFLQNEEQYNLIEDLIATRAQTLGMSVKEYFDHTGLQFEHIKDENELIASFTTFTDDAEAIITAFGNADITSVINELGRVFRRDLDSDMQKVADAFVGVEEGGVWDQTAEDTFAAGWENYIATGQAPSQEVEGLFKKLASWITSIYKSIKGSSIDIMIPPEMVKVYDSLLVKKTVASNNATGIKDAASDNPLNIPTIEEPVEDEIPEIAEDDIEIIEPPEEPPVIEEPIEDEIPEVTEVEKPKGKKPLKPFKFWLDGTKVITNAIRDPEELGEYSTIDPTPSGRDIFDDIQEGWTGVEAANWYIQYGDEMQQAIAKRILRLLERIEVKVIEVNTEYAEGIPVIIHDAYGLHMFNKPTKRNLVWVRGKSWGELAPSQDTILHELVHAATVIQIEKAQDLISTDPTNPLVRNYRALEHFRVQLQYRYTTQNAIHGFPTAAFENVKELLAYGMTEPIFMKWLSSLDMRVIDQHGQSKPVRAITKFVNMIRALLFIPKSEETALIRVIQFGDLFMPTKKELNKVRKEANERLGIKPSDTYDVTLGSYYSASVDQQKADPMRKRKEPTSEALVERIKREREATERVLAAYDAAIAKRIKKGTSEKVAAREQKKAMLRAMRAMFDAGDLHGYRIARDHFKAILARDRARYAAQKKHNVLRKSIIKKLERGMPSKVHGRIFVKIDPDVAKLFRDVLKVLHPLKTNKQIRELYDARLNQGFGNYGISTNEVDYIINTFLDGAVSRNDSGVKILERLNSDIAMLLTGETMNSPMMKKLKAVKEMRKDLISDINGGNTVDSPLTDTRLLHRERQKSKTAREKIITSTFGKTNIFGLTGLLKIATSHAPGLESTLSKLANFYEAKQKKSTRIRQEQAKVMLMYKTVFGLDENKTNYALFQKWKEDTKPVYPIAGVEMSKSQIRQLWMYMQDPTLTNRLVMQFTNPALREAAKNEELTEQEQIDLEQQMAIEYNVIVDQVEQIMTDQDIEFANMLREHFNSQEQYDVVNEVHKKLNGIELGRIEGYVPIRAAHYLDLKETFDRAHEASQFKHDDYIRKTPESGKSLRERAKNADNFQIRLDGDITLYNSYTEEMSHYIAYADQAQTVRMILEDKHVKQAIEVEYGHKLYANIMHSLEDVLADGIHTRTQYPRLDKFRAAFVRSTIGASFGVFMKQQISVVQYMQHMPAKDFTAGMAKFWSAPVEHFGEMMQHDFIKNRSSSIDRDLKQTVVGAEYRAFSINPTVSNLITLNVMLGDSAAIMQGAWVYKEYLKTQGMTEEQALAEAFKKSEETQQSGSMQELSVTQRGGSFAQFATMYSTGPVQAARQIIESVRDYAAGKITFKQAAKTVFIYQVLVPNLFAVAAMALSSGEEDKKLRTMLVASALGPMSSIYVVGEVIANAAKRLTGLKAYSTEGAFADVIDGVMDLVDGIDFDKDVTFDDFAKAVQAVTVLTGHGVPVTRITRPAQNIVEGEWKRAILQQKPE